MSNKNNFDDGQFIVSYELLVLLAWLCDNEQDALQALVDRALANGLQEKLNVGLNFGEAEAEILQQTIIDFFAIMENMVVESGEQDQLKQILHRNMFPAIDHIDSTVFDHKTVAQSVEKAVSVKEKYSSRPSKDVLMKELLKRWKPSKKTYAN